MKEPGRFCLCFALGPIGYFDCQLLQANVQLIGIQSLEKIWTIAFFRMVFRSKPIRKSIGRKLSGANARTFYNLLHYNGLSFRLHQIDLPNLTPGNRNNRHGSGRNLANLSRAHQKIPKPPNRSFLNHGRPSLRCATFVSNVPRQHTRCLY